MVQARAILAEVSGNNRTFVVLKFAKPVVFRVAQPEIIAPLWY